MASESHQEQVCLDRISKMPTTVINKILMCLPIREALATSRLSPTWRCRWMSIPELVFDDLRASLNAQRFNKWVNFIRNVLLLHEGNITKFQVSNFLDYASSDVDLDRWLLFLSRKKLMTLVIQFLEHSSYACHSSIFSYQGLTSLVLEHCGLYVPPKTRFKGFKNLIFLELRYVTFNQETIEFLVNSSPFLQTLFIVGDSEPNVPTLDISAPNLKKCTIKGKCEHVRFIKTPKLKVIDINSCVNGKPVRCKFEQNVDQLCQLQEATISQPLIECLSLSNFFEGLPITYHHLKIIHLDICFEDPRQILAVFWFFRSAPLLKKMVILPVKHDNNNVSYADLCLDKFYETLGKEEAVLQSLEVFELGEVISMGFNGSENELKFIEFVLLKACGLQKMTIRWKINAPQDHERDIKALLKLVQFQRASSRLKINLFFPGSRLSCIH